MALLIRISAFVSIFAVLAVIVAVTLLPVNVPFSGWLFGSAVDFETESELQSRITLPAGFKINIYATGIEDARFMQLTPAGDILVTSTDDGNVVLVERDRDGDGRSDGVEILDSGLDLPHGIWLDGE
ncbi:MAG: sorbosone dehydrogenase family protein, partial [Gammaproteobacteria bacterium]|nr:sorbosone dehydrogenase family protein [Gammaproteobacteria bacterium]